MAVALLTAAQVYLSARKWAFVLACHDGHATQPQAFYFRHTATGMLLGQVLPVQVGTAAARAVALKLNDQQRPLLTGSYTSVYEQAFDILAPLALVPACLLALTADLSFFTWTATALGSLVATVGLVALAWALGLVAGGVVSRWRRGRSRVLGSG